MIRLNVKQILPVGLTNVNKPENKLSVYPNPSDGFFKVQMDDGISEFQLFDNRGRMIFQKQNMIPSKTERINLENEGSGLYFMKVIDPSGKPTFKKLIVK